MFAMVPQICCIAPKMCGMVPKMRGMMPKMWGHGAKNVWHCAKTVWHCAENVWHGAPIPQSPNPIIPQSHNSPILQSPNPQIPQSPNPPIPYSMEYYKSLGATNQRINRQGDGHTSYQPSKQARIVISRPSDQFLRVGKNHPVVIKKSLKNVPSNH